MMKSGHDPKPFDYETFFEMIKVGDHFCFNKFINDLKSVDMCNLLNCSNDKGITALMFAIIHQRKVMIRVLLNEGVDVNGLSRIDTNLNLFSEPRIRTPLISAAASGNAAIVQLLLEHKASVEGIRDEKGRTALFFAFTKPEEGQEIAELLLAAGADVHAERFDDDKTILHECVDQKVDPKVIDFWMSKANHSLLNRQDQHGNTPLMYAEQKGDSALVLKFLALGADIVVCNKAGKIIYNFYANPYCKLERTSEHRLESIKFPEEKIPSDMLCPITGKIMTVPVKASDGKTYDYAAIKKAWYTDPTMRSKINNDFEQENAVNLALFAKILRFIVDKEVENTAEKNTKMENKLEKPNLFNKSLPPQLPIENENNPTSPTPLIPLPCPSPTGSP